MPLLRQVEFAFRIVAGIADPGRLGALQDAGVTAPGYNDAEQNLDLETTARELLRSLGAARIASELRVEWNSRLKTAAGRADYREKLISLNPQLVDHPTEIDLGIADEKRCHNLPFPVRTYTARFIYRCPNCLQEFPRVRRMRRAVACLACCRKHNGGGFDPRFRLQPLSSS